MEKTFPGEPSPQRRIAGAGPDEMPLEEARRIVGRARRALIRRVLRIASIAAPWFIIAYGGFLLLPWVNHRDPIRGQAMAAAVMALGFALVPLTLRPPRRFLGIAVAAMILVAAPSATYWVGGGHRFAYGSDGSLTLESELSPSSIALGGDDRVELRLELVNTGTTTVRVPGRYNCAGFDWRLTDTNGSEVRSLDPPPPNMSRAPYDDSIFVELGPGARLTCQTRLVFAWSENASFGLLLPQRGAYELDSQYVGLDLSVEHTTLPYYNRPVTGQARTITVF